MSGEADTIRATCTAETAGYDGMFGVYCDLPMGHSGPHNDGFVEWDFVDPEFRNSKTPDALDVLVAENERYRDALEAVEWSGYSYVGLEPCPACGNERVKGHAAGCLVGAALAGGGDA